MFQVKYILVLTLGSTLNRQLRLKIQDFGADYRHDEYQFG